MSSRDPIICSRTDLKCYILRKLGDPVIRIEITQDQLCDSIDDAVQRFLEIAHDGASVRFKEIKLANGKREYKLDYDVMAITKAYDMSNVNSFDAVFPGKVLADSVGQSFSGNTFDLLTIDMFYKHLADLDIVLNIERQYEFNATTKNLYLYDIPDQTVFTKIGILYYRAIPDDDDNLYDNRWIKEYATALARQQWGMNLIKYETALVPGQLSLNATRILDEANAAIDRLLLELEEMHQMPPDFFVG